MNSNKKSLLWWVYRGLESKFGYPTKNTSTVYFI